MRKLPRQLAKKRQSGATAVELAISMMVFLLIVFGVLEFGRVFYLVSTVQEVTRHAARQQVVSWSGETSTIQRTAVFGSGNQDVSLPAGSEVSNLRVRITFHKELRDAYSAEKPITPASGSDPESNINACLDNSDKCIRFVRASLEEVDGTPVHYVPMIPLFSFLDIPIPVSTVVMPAEALGLQ